MNTLANNLIKEYQQWCKDKAYPEMSADELLRETHMVDGTERQESYEEYVVSDSNDRLWLKEFIQRREIAGF